MDLEMIDKYFFLKEKIILPHLIIKNKKLNAVPIFGSCKFSFFQSMNQLLNFTDVVNF